MATYTLTVYALTEYVTTHTFHDYAETQQIAREYECLGYDVYHCDDYLAEEAKSYMADQWPLHDEHVFSYLVATLPF